MLAVLRLALGWHFLYEGVWKIRHPDLFLGETEGFLSGARGPVAGLFYAMLPDIDGRQRLEDNLPRVEGKDKEVDIEATKACKVAKSWDDLRQKFVNYYAPAAGSDDAQKKLHEQLSAEAQKVYDWHLKGLNEFVNENGGKIKAHFESLKRYQDGRKTDPHTMFQTQRRWDEMQDLRKEAKGWISDVDARENALKSDLLGLLRKNRKPEKEAVARADKEAAEKAGAKKTADAAAKKPAGADAKKADEKKNAPSPPAPLPEGEGKTKGKPSSPAPLAATTIVLVDFSPLADGRPELGPFTPSSKPWEWTRIEQLAFLLTWALFGIGLCLMLGLFTRPAALAGAGFMLFVVMSQPSYPGVYPLDPPQLGHALLVNKDFVEMVALLVIASTCLGRWTGLDFFIHKYLVKPFCCRCGDEATSEGGKA
jgi:uncharacterized membrane protein YphA (DoxX/SURF4 family)